jgi:putative PIN family toxin of toxin-antitoxin system
LLVPNSPPSRAVLKIEAEGTFLFSDATIMELAMVLARRKFDRYVERELRNRYLARVIDISERIVVTAAVATCRDPKDNRLLEVAGDGKADVLVTGDRDLLVLGRHESTPILSPAAFLAGW